MRWATNQENQQNAKLSSKNTSGCKGVSFNKTKNKWRARITIDGIEIHLGYFDNEQDAALAYDVATIFYSGAFMKILMLHGINHNMFGKRDPKQYGTTTLAQIDEQLLALGRQR